VYDCNECLVLYLRVCVKKIRIAVLFQRLPEVNWSWVELFELKKKVFHFVCIVNTYLCALDDLASLALTVPVPCFKYNMQVLK
jgi:hypothetical protein